MPWNNLVTDSPDSPHLLAAKTKGHYLIAIAENDDRHAPSEKGILRETLTNAGVPAKVEVYAAAHWVDSAGLRSL